MNANSRNRSLTPALCCGIAGNIIWGSSYLFTRIAQQESSPMVQLALRFILAFFLLNLMLLLGWKKLQLRGKKLKPLIILSCVEPVYFSAKAMAFIILTAPFPVLCWLLSPLLPLASARWS